VADEWLRPCESCGQIAPLLAAYREVGGCVIGAYWVCQQCADNDDANAAVFAGEEEER
jgi:hypothetical protein